MAMGIEPFYIETGKRVQERRNKRGMTQEQLGSRLNPATTRASIANMEAGKQRILVHTLVQLADILGVKILDLLPVNKELPANKSSDIASELQKKLKITKATAQKYAQKIESTVTPKKHKKL